MEAHVSVQGLKGGGMRLFEVYLSYLMWKEALKACSRSSSSLKSKRRDIDRRCFCVDEDNHIFPMAVQNVKLFQELLAFDEKCVKSSSRLWTVYCQMFPIPDHDLERPVGIFNKSIFQGSTGAHSRCWHKLMKTFEAVEQHTVLTSVHISVWSKFLYKTVSSLSWR